MKKYRKLKIGIVGGGYWSTNIIKTLEDNSFNNVYVFEIDKIKQKNLKNKFSFLKFCNSLSDFLKTKYDVVLLITPPSTHYKLAKKILNAGNNIFIEKPSTLSTKNLEKIIKLAKNKNRLLMSGYIYCYNVYIQFIKKILKQKKLGKIKYIYCERSNLGPIRNDNPCYWDLASHDISTIKYLFNQDIKVEKVLTHNLLNSKLSDISTISLKSKSINVEIKSSWINPEKIRKLIIVGNKKMLQFDEMDQKNKIKIYDKYAEYPNISKFEKNFFTPKANIYLGKTYTPKIKFKSPMICELEHLFDCVAKKRNPFTSGEYALKVMKVLEMVDKKVN